MSFIPIVFEEEMLPSVNKKDMIIGKISRTEAHKNSDIIHRIIAVAIYNAKDEILLQKRSILKDIFPGCWDLSVAGHVMYGEEYLEAAVKELYEELRIKVSKKVLIPIEKFFIKTSWESEFCQMYKYTLKEGENVFFSKNEVAETKFVTQDELKYMISNSSIKWNPKTKRIFNKLGTTFQRRKNLHQYFTIIL